MRMLNPRLIAFMLLLSFSEIVCATPCNISGFRQECEVPVQPKPTKRHQSYIFCSTGYGYVTTTSFDQLTRYHRRDVNMVLKVDGELVSVQCTPARRLDLADLDR